MLLAVAGNAQQQPFQRKATSNLRVKQWVINADSTILDTLSIIPNTFSVHNLPDSLYRLDYVNASSVLEKACAGQPDYHLPCIPIQAESIASAAKFR
jgi:hypothetical protein